MMTRHFLHGNIQKTNFCRFLRIGVIVTLVLKRQLFYINNICCFIITVLLGRLE